MGDVDPHRFKKLSVKQLPKRERLEGGDEKFWNKFQPPVVVRESAAVTSVHFSPSAPHDFAVTSGSRVQIYSGVTNGLKKSIARFHEVAYCGRFRGDGKLLAAGSEEGVVKVFDVSSRAVLRQLRAHNKPTKAVCFSHDGLRIVSGSDDTAVRYWDIATEACLSSLTGHGDYVRGVVASPATSDLFLSCSYDHRLMLWDVRCQTCALRLDHGAPVEAALVFPSGGTCVSAGGSYVKVWDLLGGGRLLAAFSSHAKTVTSLAFDGSSQRLLSGSLDQMVKVHSVADYSVVKSLSLPAPVLSVAMSPSDSHVVVGMTNRLLSILRRPLQSSKGDDKGLPLSVPTAPRGGTYRYFVRGKKYKPTEDEYLVAVSRKKHLKPYEIKLKSFCYREALDAALKPPPKAPNRKWQRGTDKEHARVVYSLVLELARRDGLASALSGRTEKELLPLVGFLEKHMLDPKFSSLFLDVCEMVVDIYGSSLSLSRALKSRFARLNSRVAREISTHQLSSQLLGMLDTILTAASVTERHPVPSPPNLTSHDHTSALPTSYGPTPAPSTDLGSQSVT